MVKVYSFRVYDVAKGDWNYAPMKFSNEMVKMARGEIIPGTEEEVSEKDLDIYGRYAANEASS